ncbi:MAG: hypothetical protein IPK85_23535 [Gemmatimonadetes bacterium]|nr:hypothetical protein [Gemmatimonadota bacterium]
MSQRRSEIIETLAGPLYLIAFLLIATPALDFVSGVLPLRLDNIEWRFASVGLLSGFLLTPVLGIVLAILVAASSGHDLMQRLTAFLLIGLSLAFTLLLVFFLLDIVQLRSAVQAESKSQFEGAAWKAVAKHLLFVVVMFWLGLRMLKVPRSVSASHKRPAAVIIGS